MTAKTSARHQLLRVIYECQKKSGHETWHALVEWLEKLRSREEKSFMEDMGDCWWNEREFQLLLMYLVEAGLINYTIPNGVQVRLTKLGWMIAVMIELDADIEAARPALAPSQAEV